MRVVSHIRKLVEDLGSADELARAIRIDRRSALKLIEDRNWELRRETLHRLLLLGFEQGLDHGVFEVRQHELWDTFKGAQASLFRADLTWDTKVEGSIRDFLAHLDCAPTLANTGESVEAMRDIIRTRNCIFIGSPKANPATEVALALLDGVSPFDSSAANRDRMSIQFLGKSSFHKTGASSILTESTWCGILVRPPRKRAPLRVKVDWLTGDEFRGPAREGEDGAAIVVCRKPCGATENVTTIVVCGYTGLATQQAAEELIHGEPPISVEQLERAGCPIRIVQTFRFKKRAYRSQRNLDLLKTAVPGSTRWHQPSE